MELITRRGFRIEVTIECDECEEKVDAAIQLGSAHYDSEYEGPPKLICLSCLQKAVELFKGIEKEIETK